MSICNILVLITVAIQVAECIYDQWGFFFYIIGPPAFHPRQAPYAGKSLQLLPLPTTTTTATTRTAVSTARLPIAGGNCWGNSHRCSREPGEAPTTKPQPWRSIKHQGDCQRQQLIAAEGCQRADTDTGAKAAAGKRGGGCLCGCRVGGAGRQI